MRPPPSPTPRPLTSLPTPSAPFPARLPGHRRHALKTQVFPAAVPSPSHSITGLLLTGLAPPELAVFDAFEGEEYVKTAVGVHLLQGEGEGEGGDGDGSGGDGPPLTPTEIYLWAPALAGELAEGDWDYAAFRAAELDRYTRNAAAFGVEARAAVGRGVDWGGGANECKAG